MLNKILLIIIFIVASWVLIGGYKADKINNNNINQLGMRG
jgi:hypothetical protein